MSLSEVGRKASYGKKTPTPEVKEDRRCEEDFSLCDFSGVDQSAGGARLASAGPRSLAYCGESARSCAPRLHAPAPPLPGTRQRKDKPVEGGRQRGLRKPTLHPEMVVEEYGVAAASPCE